MVMDLNYADYFRGIPNPAESLMSGFQTGFNIRESQANRALAEAQAQVVSQKREQALQMQSELAELSQKENPTADDYMRIITKYPELADKLDKNMSAMEAKEKQYKLDTAAKMYSALSSGQVTIVKDLIEEQRIAAENSGDFQTAKYMEGLGKLVDLNPAAAKTSLGMGLAQSLGPEKFTETFTSLEEESRANEVQSLEIGKKLADIGYTRAQTKKLLSEIGAGPDVPAKIQEWELYKKLKEKDPEAAAEFGNMIGISPQTSDTDIEKYVQRAAAQYKIDTKEDMPPGLMNKAALEIKRAQAQEVRANTLAERLAEAETAERIAYNTKKGTQLAEIAFAADLIHARGEQTEEEKAQTAKSRMEGNLAKLTQHYLKLDSLGGITNTDNPGIANVWARVKSTAGAQAFQNALGTDEQSVRNAIKTIKPLLIQDIRQSTNMSARGLDSEKELEFYLKAATDDKTDIQSNLAALVVLSEAYGNGRIAQTIKEKLDPKLIERISNEGQAILNGSLLSPEERQERSGTSTQQPSYMQFATQGAQ